MRRGDQLHGLAGLDLVEVGAPGAQGRRGQQGGGKLESRRLRMGWRSCMSRSFSHGSPPRHRLGPMLSREALWQRAQRRRVSGGLPWALAAACGVPWLVPETWDGQLSRPGSRPRAGPLVAATLPLAFRRRRFWAAALALALAWGALGGLGRLARWEAAAARRASRRLAGTLDAPWTPGGAPCAARLRVGRPAALRGAEPPPDACPAGGRRPPAPGTPVRFRGDLAPVEPAPAFLAERPLWRARDAGAPRAAPPAPPPWLLEPLGPPGPGRCPRGRPWRRSGGSRALASARRGPGPLGALTLGIPPAQEDDLQPLRPERHHPHPGGLGPPGDPGDGRAGGPLAAPPGPGQPLGRGGGGAWATALLVGFSAPVWRGLPHGPGLGAGRGTGWKLPPVLTLHGALLAWLMTHPAAGCDPGFLLSWLALAGLSGARSPWRACWRRWRAGSPCPWPGSWGPG